MTAARAEPTVVVRAGRCADRRTTSELSRWWQPAPCDGADGGALLPTEDEAPPTRDRRHRLAHP